MLKKKQTIIIIIGIFIITLISIFGILNQKTNQLKKLATTLEEKNTEIAEERDRLIELNFSHLEDQIKDKIDTLLDLGEHIANTNMKNTIDINKDQMEISKKIFNRGLYLDGLNSIIFVDKNGYFISVVYKPKQEAWLIDLEKETGDVYKYDENAKDFVYSYEIGPFDYRIIDAYESINKENPESWFEPHMTLESEYIIDFSKGIFDKNGEKLGIWESQMSLTSIKEYLEEIKPTPNTTMNLIFTPKDEIELHESIFKNNVVRYTEYNRDNLNWTILWIIPNEEFENYENL